jgi:hypothetical protein
MPTTGRRSGALGRLVTALFHPQLELALRYRALAAQFGVEAAAMTPTPLSSLPLQRCLRGSDGVRILLGASQRLVPPQ